MVCQPDSTETQKRFHLKFHLNGFSTSTWWFYIVGIDPYLYWCLPFLEIGETTWQQSNSILLSNSSRRHCVLFVSSLSLSSRKDETEYPLRSTVTPCSSKRKLLLGDILRIYKTINVTGFIELRKLYKSRLFCRKLCSKIGRDNQFRRKKIWYIHQSNLKLTKLNRVWNFYVMIRQTLSVVKVWELVIFAWINFDELQSKCVISIRRGGRILVMFHVLMSSSWWTRPNRNWRANGALTGSWKSRTNYMVHGTNNDTDPSSLHFILNGPWSNWQQDRTSTLDLHVKGFASNPFGTGRIRKKRNETESWIGHL